MSPALWGAAGTAAGVLLVVVVPTVWHLATCKTCRPRRAVEVGGRQGRGNPPAVPPVRPPRGQLPRTNYASHDPLSLVVACHVGDATPGLKMRGDNPWGGNVLAWWLIADARIKGLRDKAAAYAAARPWAPWWPGARVGCGCGDCRAYVLGRPEGVSVGGKHYPAQPASWWHAGRPVEHTRPRMAA